MSQATQPIPTTQEKSQGASGILGRIFRTREIGVLAALLVLCLLMSFASPYFLKTENLFNVLRGMSTIGIMAIGMTMVIVSGGIDLSVGSVAAVSAMLTARLMTYNNLPPWISVICGLLMGLLLGAINGTIITRIKVNPFITTLGMMSIARGLTYLLASGLKGTVASNIPMRNEAVNFLGAGKIGAVPFPVIEMVVLVTVFSLFLQHFVLGRQIYAVGSNEQAARLSGVNVANVRLFVYTLLGMLAALAGVMGAGLLSTAPTNLGLGTELDVIAAVVIGGASLAGGEGTILGAVIGAAIMAVIRNAFVLLKLPIYLQTIAIGVVIIVAVALDQLRKHRS
jgi:ribose transport system permease protein